MDISFDEAFSYFIAKEGIPNLISGVLYDNHPPFYFVLLHFWMKFFGEGELAIRIPSTLAGLFAIVVFYFILKELFNNIYALKGSILLALLPSMIYFSTQARMYSLFLLLSLMSTFAWLKLLKGFKKKIALLFIAVFFLTIFTHYYGYLLSIPYFLITLKQKNRSKYFLVLLAPLVLSLPWVYKYLTSSHPGAFIQNSFVAIPFVFASFIVDPVTLIKTFTSQSTTIPKLLFLFAFMLSMLTFLRGVRVLTSKRAVSEYLVILFSPLIFLFFANLFTPIFSVRPTLILVPYFLIILLFGLSSLSKKLSHRIYLLMLLLLVLLNISLHLTPNLKGLEIKRALYLLSNEPSIYHTSILTYYPFRYYDREKQNFLVTKNPLSPQTSEIIGGETVVIPKDLPALTLLDAKNGAEISEVGSILTELRKIYRLEKTTTLGDITIYFFTLPP